MSRLPGDASLAKAAARKYFYVRHLGTFLIQRRLSAKAHIDVGSSPYCFNFLCWPCAFSHGSPHHLLSSAAGRLVSIFALDTATREKVTHISMFAPVIHCTQIPRSRVCILPTPIQLLAKSLPLQPYRVCISIPFSLPFSFFCDIGQTVLM